MMVVSKRLLLNNYYTYPFKIIDIIMIAKAINIPYNIHFLIKLILLPI